MNLICMAATECHCPTSISMLRWEIMTTADTGVEKDIAVDKEVASFSIKHWESLGCPPVGHRS